MQYCYVSYRQAVVWARTSPCSLSYDTHIALTTFLGTAATLLAYRVLIITFKREGMHW